MKENIDKVKNIQSAIFTLLAAISDAQITIIDGSEEWTPGTTTVSCGLLLEVYFFLFLFFFKTLLFIFFISILYLNNYNGYLSLKLVEKNYVN